MAEEWISAAEAFKLVANALGAEQAPIAICSRALVGLIEAKALRVAWYDNTWEDGAVPHRFWWGKGGASLQQNWHTGDFQTSVEDDRSVAVYGVFFARSGIEALIGPALSARENLSDPMAPRGGRPPLAWWDDLWIEICRRLYVGDLKPKKQADIEHAMMRWAAAHGYDHGVTTIRARARKLWAALNKKDEN